MDASIITLSPELVSSIFNHLGASDACSLRVTYSQLEYQTRRDFTRKFLTSPRIRLSTRHLEEFAQLCTTKDMFSAVKEMHISLYLPELSYRTALDRIEKELATSGKSSHHFRQYIANFRSEQQSDLSSSLYEFLSRFEKL